MLNLNCLDNYRLTKEIIEDNKYKKILYKKKDLDIFIKYIKNNYKPIKNNSKVYNNRLYIDRIYYYISSKTNLITAIFIYSNKINNEKVYAIAKEYKEREFILYDWREYCWLKEN